MKKIVSLVIAALCGILTTYAERISIADLEVKPGEKVLANIMLENERTDIVAFQMDLSLPEGISINKTECLLSSRFADQEQQLTVGKLSSGEIRLTSTSFSLTPINGTNGTLVTVSLTAAKDFARGQVKIGNIRLFTSNSEKITIENVSFTINSLHKLTYKVDGEEYKDSTVAYGTTLTPEAELTKEGYTFSGWSEIPTTMPASDVVVTGTFSVNSYFLFYVLDGGIYKALNVKYGTEILPEAVEEKEGYTFSGWSDLPETMPAHDITIQGKYNIHSHTLTYKVDGEIYKTYTLDYHSPITPEQAISKEGCSFSGWSEIPELMPDNDVVVTGSFTVNNYTLTYKVDGEEYKTDSITYNTNITPETEPTKEGYTFSGWSEIPTTMPASDVVVTGTFAINTYAITYKVDGEIYKTDSVTYNASITPETEPTKDGYTFSGWSEIPTTMPANDVVVTGTFAINTYALTYKVDGEVYKTDSVTYNANITPESEPTREGYTFSGWSEIPETMPANDVVVSGTFAINTYAIMYKVDGEAYKTDSVTYNASITPETEPTKEGYTFSGWSEIPTTMPASDVVVTGTFTVNNYTLTYKVDGEEYKTSSIAFGTTLTTETEPTKEGYTFSGWSEIPTTMPANDVTITGTFSINTYAITYKVDGEAYKTDSITYNASITPETEPTKEGYTFSGWSEIPATMPANDVVVTGTFTINTYAITYKVDGEVYKTDSVTYNAVVTPEAEPTKEGYTFSGWSEIPTTMPASDVVVTGTFAINTYALTYKVDGEEYKTDSVTYNASITPETEPTKEGYTFSGWSEIPATMPTNDVVVTGTFTINTYAITYKVDGEVYKTDSVTYNAAITPEAAPTKEGYTFSGWNEIPETMPASDVVVTGTFAINTYAVTYKVDGEEYKTDSITYNATITPETEPTKEGYTFSGWSEIPETMPASDVVVSGTFAINTYALTYKVDGEAYKTDSITYNASITPETEPTKEGYTFSGWSEIPETMPASDVVVSGTFAINTYAITYKVDGEIYKTDSVTYNASITPETEPTKEGYTFSGWSEIPETMPANDVVVSGTFAINTYAVTYKVDGEEYKTDSVTYNASITPETEPTKEGYTFSGWSEIPTTMPASDVVVTGAFAINTYALTYKVDGEEYKTDSVTYNASITPEIEPTKEGYTFSGWSEIPTTMPASDVVVSGTFSVNTYQVTFMYGDEVLKTDSVEYGAVIPLPESLESDRYTLVEWLDVPETMPAHDLIIYADYTDGIEGMRNERMVYAIYDLSGRRIAKMQRGVNIIRYSDGTSKRVMVK